MSPDDPEAWTPLPAHESASWAPAVESGMPPPRDPWAPLGWNWFGFNHEQRQGRMPFDARNAAHWLVGGFTGAVVFLLVVAVVASFFQYLSGQSVPLGDDTSDVVFAFALLVQMAVFIAPALLWVGVFYSQGIRAWGERLLLQSRSYGVDTALGVGAGLLLVLGTYLFVFLLILVTGYEPENPVVEDLGASVSWPMAFFIAFAAGTGEEVFFRGFLQPRFGIVATNLFFGMVHLSYGEPLQVVVPTLLGFAFSWLVLRRRSLVPAIVAHFTFNFTNLAMLKLLPEFGGG